MLNSTPHQKKSRSALFERNGILRTWSHGRNLVGLCCRLFEVSPLKTLQKNPQKFRFQPLPTSLRSVYPPGRLPAEGMNGAASYSIRTGTARARAPAGAKSKSPLGASSTQGRLLFLIYLSQLSKPREKHLHFHLLSQIPFSLFSFLSYPVRQSIPKPPPSPGRRCIFSRSIESKLC